jgi:hypothetical protein
MIVEDTIIGYELVPVRRPNRRGSITTQAFILCSSCNSAISAVGGPRRNMLCFSCLEKLDLLNKLSQP